MTGTAKPLDLSPDSPFRRSDFGLMTRGLKSQIRNALPPHPFGPPSKEEFSHG
jgi:hypothetical protein